MKIVATFDYFGHTISIQLEIKDFFTANPFCEKLYYTVNLKISSISLTSLLCESVMGQLVVAIVDFKL